MEELGGKEDYTLIQLQNLDHSQINQLTYDALN